MVASLLYAHCSGVLSSRRIEAACDVDVAFRVVCGNVAPGHTTTARFRARYESALKGLFTASFAAVRASGMTNVGLIAVDGTKMAAAASLEANRTKDSIDTAVDEPTAAAAAAKLRGRKPRALGEKAGAKQRRVNTTDPDSGVMSTKKGFVQGYNAQAVANDEQIIVAAEVTCKHNDLGQLHPMFEATEESLAEAGIEATPESCWLTPDTPRRRASPPSTRVTPTATSQPGT